MGRHPRRLWQLRERRLTSLIWATGTGPVRPTSFRQQLLRSTIHGACQYVCVRTSSEDLYWAEDLLAEGLSEEAACQQEGKERKKMDTPSLVRG